MPTPQRGRIGGMLIGLWHGRQFEHPTLLAIISRNVIRPAPTFFLSNYCILVMISIWCARTLVWPGNKDSPAAASSFDTSVSRCSRVERRHHRSLRFSRRRVACPAFRRPYSPTVSRIWYGRCGDRRGGVILTLLRVGLATRPQKLGGARRIATTC
jgi:hypothetical protein